jgi:protein TonB
MSDVLTMDGFGEFGDFEGMLAGLLRERVEVDAPRGFEQRLLARLAQEEASMVIAVRPFGFAESVKTPRRSWSMGGAVVAHVVVLAVVLALASERTAPYRRVMTPVEMVETVELTPPPRLMPQPKVAGGGGGQPDHAPVTAGHLPKFSTEQLLPPKAPPTVDPKLVVEPTVVAQDLKMADNKMPDLGSPSSTLKGFSMGNGMGGGIGSGNGNGIGPGSGGNAGDGVMEVGGGVSPPKVIYQVDAEFSEEARKAKFSGDVYVSVIVDEQGRPTHVHVSRGVGMGLDEKAVEAVRQYKFKPAMLKGKPVKVAVDVNVVFNIY